MPSRPIVHVVDDDEAMRHSLAFVLDVNGFTACLHDSATAFLAARPEPVEGCLVTDIRMPGLSGLDLVRQLNQQKARYPVIIMTGHGDVPLAVEAMKAGVVDFIEKPFSDEIFLNAVRAALALRPGDDEQAQARLQAQRRIAELSPRERDVLVGVAAGKSNKAIAADLDISPRTVEVYRANLMAKTEARTVADLVRMALAAGL
jgi:two-component system response regulator FixJ